MYRQYFNALFGAVGRITVYSVLFASVLVAALIFATAVFSAWPAVHSTLSQSLSL